MWTLGTWFRDGIDSVRLMVGLNDLYGLPQPKRLYDSMILITPFRKELKVDDNHVYEVSLVYAHLI